MVTLDSRLMPLGVMPAESVVHVLHPGDVALAQAGERVETLLGSCVAVLLTDRRRTVAAMCHVVYTGQAPSGHAKDTRYAEQAFASMFALLRSVGISPELCEAFVFGGGNMFPGMADAMDVGGRNVQHVLALLSASKVQVCSQQTGGHCYRKVAWQVGQSAPGQAVVTVHVESFKT